MSLSHEQMEIRRSGIGASEAAAVLGLSPWAGPIDVYLSKLGLSEPKPETPAMRLGNRLESVVLDMYEEEIGEHAIRTGERTLRHPEHPVVLATPDGMVNPSWLVEAKTTSHDDGWGEPGTDQIPEWYLVQVAVQMAVTGAERCDVAVLNVLRSDFRIYRVNRDLDLEAAILPRLVSFWKNHVEKQEAPPLDGSAGWTDYLKAKFPRHGEALVSADDAQLVAIVRGIGLLKAAMKIDEGNLAIAENALRARIGENLGVEGWWGKATWKRTADGKRTDWEAVAREIADRFEALAPELTDVRHEIARKHTKTTEGSRRLLVTPSKRLLEQQQTGAAGEIGEAQ